MLPGSLRMTYRGLPPEICRRPESIVSARKLLLGLLYLLFASAAPCQDTLSVLGDRTCGAWTESRKNPDSSDYRTAESWLLGFLSGQAAMGYILPKETHAEAVTRWMDEYCQSHPLESISTGGQDLFWELRGKKN